VKHQRTNRGQILILLATWLLFGGGAASALVVYDRPASELKKAIKRVVPDDVRRDALLADLKKWKSGQKKRDKVVDRDRDALFRALQRRETKRQEADLIAVKLDGTFREMDREFIDLRFRLKDHLTGPEWSELVTRANP
jgi:hypothetical protein